MPYRLKCSFECYVTPEKRMLRRVTRAEGNEGHKSPKIALDNT